jgi:hypothetical protein
VEFDLFPRPLDSSHVISKGAADGVDVGSAQALI